MPPFISVCKCSVLHWPAGRQDCLRTENKSLSDKPITSKARATPNRLPDAWQRRRRGTHRSYPYRRVIGDTEGTAWAAQSTAVTVCRYRAAAPRRACIFPVPGVSIRTVPPSENTAHIPQSKERFTRRPRAGPDSAIATWRRHKDRRGFPSRKPDERPEPTRQLMVPGVPSARSGKHRTSLKLIHGGFMR